MSKSKVNQWLEEKVKERTLELQEAYDKLEKANLELQNLDVAKGEFLNLISHEIRTPLNGILGFTRLLKEELKSSEVYTMIHYLDISASRLEKFSLIALQITELKTRNRPIASENIPVNRLIEHAFEAVREKIQTKGVTVETEGNVNKIKIPGEKKLLDICFESLLDNAVKYSDQGGLVIIRIGTDKQGVHCEFIDEGCGFSAEALKNLYQFFGLGEQHIDQNVGLDLALVKMIMDAHQGKIEIRNNESRGATVRLVFE